MQVAIVNRQLSKFLTIRQLSISQTLKARLDVEQNALKTDILSVNGKIDNLSSDIKNSIGYQINGLLPNYWIEHLVTKIPEVNAITSEAALNGDSFVFFTDYHIEQNSGYSHLLIKQILDKTSVNKVMFGGDIFNGADTKEKAIEKANIFIDRFAEIGIYGTRGNHEYNWNDGGSDSVEFTESEIYNELIKKKEHDVVTDENRLSFYLDNKNRKIRYIFVDGHYERDRNARAIITTTELNWLKTRMTELESGWTIVVITHNIFQMGYSHIETVVYSSNGQRIINAISEAKETMSAELACVICGHSHYDYSNTDNGFLVITTTCDSKQDGGQWVAWGKGECTINEHALDVFSINTVEKTIKAVRIGRGQNRNWSYNSN